MLVEREVLAVLGKDDLPVLALDVRALYYIGQAAVVVSLANATANRSVLAQGVAYAIADHAILVLLAFHAHEELGKHLKTLLAVEVVGIDDSKRLANHILAHQYGVVGAPGFGALGIVGATGRHFVEALEAYFAGHFVGIFGNNNAAEILLKVLADNKNDLSESGT